MEGYSFNIANSVDLISILKDLPSPPRFITVLDFKSLYPSLELPPAFCALRDLLLGIVGDRTLHKQVLEMAHMLCYNLFFMFNGAVYTQKRGVPMGSPVAGDLCEMVIRQLEQKVLPHYLPDILLYKRYIDDIIILWRNIPDVSAFVEAVNDNPYGLTVELEQVNSTGVHFLDLNISIEGPYIHTSVYRKPGTPSLYIPVGSCDPFQYKSAAFNMLIKRAFLHSSTPAALATELEHVRCVVTIHGYHKLVNRLVNRHRRTARISDIRLRLANQPEDESRIPVTYNPYVATLYKKITCKRRIKIAYRRRPTILDILRNGKDPPTPTDFRAFIPFLLRITGLTETLFTSTQPRDLWGSDYVSTMLIFCMREILRHSQLTLPIRTSKRPSTKPGLSSHRLTLNI
ncbi:uncharacterized protein [Centruroides vittatus]|uniref:uncharacterized protein n=1 Tax=Centruroides vittatus TaxID=120091 RepID=UPI003510BDE5